MKAGLIVPDDKIWCCNKLMELFRLDDMPDTENADISPRPISDILGDMTDHAVETGILSSDTTASREDHGTHHACSIGCKSTLQ